MSAPIPAPASRKRAVAGQVAGAIAGVAAGSYCGINLLIPGAVTAAIWFMGRKWISPSRPEYLPALSVQGAHLAWLALGFALLGAWGPNILDVAILGVGLIWLWVRPGIWPVLMLSAYQVVGLASNTSFILDQQTGSPEHRALCVHLGLRAIGLGAMWFAYFTVRRQRSDSV